MLGPVCSALNQFQKFALTFERMTGKDGTVIVAPVINGDHFPTCPPADAQTNPVVKNLIEAFCPTAANRNFNLLIRFRLFVSSAVENFVSSAVEDFVPSVVEDFVSSAVEDFVSSAVEDFVSSAVEDFVSSAVEDFVSSAVEDFVSSAVED
nr:hypothetical protein BaRGS_024130 [Batillaria attramentaria]